jgi:hypothetical protein
LDVVGLAWRIKEAKMTKLVLVLSVTAMLLAGFFVWKAEATPLTGAAIPLLDLGQDPFTR